MQKVERAPLRQMCLKGSRFAESAKTVAAAGIQPVFFKNGHDLFH